MGIPLRPYLQWLRCVEVLALLAEVRSATDGAIAAGFVDGAHCVRVLKRYITLSPSALAATDIQMTRCLSPMPK